MIYLGSKEMFYLMMHSTHFIYCYMVWDMVKDHSDSERGNLLLPLQELLFSISSKRLFNRQDKAWSTGWYEKLLNGSTEEGSIW